MMLTIGNILHLRYIISISIDIPLWLWNRCKIFNWWLIANRSTLPILLSWMIKSFNFCLIFVIFWFYIIKLRSLYECLFWFRWLIIKLIVFTNKGFELSCFEGIFSKTFARKWVITWYRGSWLLQSILFIKLMSVLILSCYLTFLIHYFVFVCSL
jgi:hypothetical protein